MHTNAQPQLALYMHKESDDKVQYVWAEKVFSEGYVWFEASENCW